MSLAVHATSADLDGVVDVLTAAFADDPVQRWLFEPADDPDAGRRALFEIFVPDYFWLGHLHVVADGGGVAGAALWAPPDRNPLQGERVQDLLVALDAHLGQETLPRLGELAHSAEFRPAEPHFYLGILGVDPTRQSAGHGTALIAPVLAECDRTGVLAHLESSNPRNVPFYERHGFRVVDEHRCGVDGPPLAIMTRSPC